MLKLIYMTPFKKDFKKQKIKMNFDDFNEFFEVINKLRNSEVLEEKYIDHPLSGEYKDCRDCHIKPDLVLIYKINKKEHNLTLIRFNSHSELF
ncbi:MAG: type II toxin-antitoxin system YafQ family toxin [Clostridiales bacterium]